jgi:hypothetical protein
MKLAALAIAGLVAIQQPSMNQVIERLDAYLLAYEPQLSELIADETMQQEVRGLPPMDVMSGEGRSRLRRRLASEVAFIALPQEAGWLGFRHVKTVNNIPVALGDQSLSTSLKIQGLDAARELLQDSAAHNLGLQRTTNLPNLPLEFLHRRNRKRLVARADGRETVRGTRAERLVFIERMTPTLITNPDTGADMPSVIRAWVDPQTGQLLRAEVNTFRVVNAKQHEHQVRVEFVPNNALGLMVPSEMREEFPVQRSGTGTSVARYTNFRRFQTSARIVPQ